MLKPQSKCPKSKTAAFNSCPIDYGKEESINVLGFFKRKTNTEPVAESSLKETREFQLARLHFLIAVASI